MDGSVLVNVTVVVLPAGAAAESVNVPVVLAPPVTVLAASVKLASVGGATTESTAVLLEPFSAAVIVAITGKVPAAAGHEADCNVHTVKVWLVEPAGTSTLVALGWKLTVGSLLLSVTTAPPDCAGPESVTVPVETSPCTTLVGLSVSVLTVTDEAGFTVRTEV